MRPRPTPLKSQPLLAPGSTVHFAMNDPEGSVLTDSVASITADYTGKNVFLTDVPHAMRHELNADNSNGGRVVLTNPSVWMQGGPYNSGYIIQYNTGIVDRNYTGLVPGDRTISSLFQVLDVGEPGSTNPIHYFECQQGFTGGVQNANRNMTGILAQQPVGTTDGRETGDLYPTLFTPDMGIYTEVMMWPIGVKEESYCYCVWDGISGGQSAGEQEILYTIATQGTATPPDSKLIEFPTMDFVGLDFAVRNMSSYISGLLHVVERPTDAQIQNCARYHQVQTPKGNKSVYPEWQNFTPAF